MKTWIRFEQLASGTLYLWYRSTQGHHDAYESYEPPIAVYKTHNGELATAHGAHAIRRPAMGYEHDRFCEVEFPSS